MSASDTKELVLDPQACAWCGMDAEQPVILNGEPVCPPCVRKIAADAPPAETG